MTRGDKSYLGSGLKFPLQVNLSLIHISEPTRR